MPGLTLPVAHVAALSIWVIALTSCASSDVSLPKLTNDAVIVAFGNSLTFGTGAGRGQSYPAVLEELTGLTVINAGVPGEVTAGGLRRLPGVLDRHRPDLVVLCHGGNDMMRRVSEGHLEQNLRSMVQLLLEREISVVLIGVPTPSLFLSTADVYTRLAEELRVPLENHIVADLLGDNRYKSDQIHPNEEGYRRLAEAVRALLQSTGAL